MSLEPIAMGELQPEATLEDCEQALHQVERNAAIQQGVILRHIRDNRLYVPQGFTSFEDYVEKRLGYTKAWASQRISLADTVAQLTMVNSPEITSERQARAIKPVLRDHGPEVAAEVLREAADDDGKLTARSITEAATRVIEPEIITAEEFVERYEADNETTPDLDDLIPADLRFQRRFWKHMKTTYDLLLDLDYPQYFEDDMVDSLDRFVKDITSKHTDFSKSRRTLRVVRGGNP